MRVLVTGNQGYIGTIMVETLLEAGFEVVGLDTSFFDGCTFGKDDRKVQAIRKDIRDITPDDLAGFDAIVHLAAISNDPVGDLKPDLTYDINHKASVNLAKAAKQVGIHRFIYSSSCSVYGASGDNVLTEDDPLNPLTPYAISKVKTEEDVSKLADSSFSPVFLRNATAYGLSPYLRVDIVLNNLVCWAYTTGKVRIMSDGSSWRPIVHIRDIAQAFTKVLVAPREKIHNQAFNVGVYNENYRVRDIAQIVRDTVPGCDLEFAGQSGPDPRSYRISFSKIERVLPEFQPIWTARLGAQELYKAFLQYGLTYDDFQGRKYIRLNQIKYLMANKYLDDTLRWNTKLALEL